MSSEDRLVPTPSQTVGPFFRLGTDALAAARLAEGVTHGTRIAVEGVVYDGEGTPVPDALIETWQADGDGSYDETGSTRWFGRVATDEAGTFRLHTLLPGRVAGPRGKLQAPHIVVAIFMRGLLKQLITRIYFADAPGNHEDPILSLVEANRHSTLLACPVSGSPGTYRWDVHLQGARETVFFDF